MHQSRTSVLRGSAWAWFDVAVRASERGGAGLESASGQRIVRREEGEVGKEVVRDLLEMRGMA